MTKSEQIFDKFGGPPVAISAGDSRLRIGHKGSPPSVACRVVAEEVYQALVSAANI